MKRQIVALTMLAAMLAAFTPVTAQAVVTIDTVLVGNMGNAADTRYVNPGYGRVDYAYNIGKYEVTAGQYTEFLNAVAKTDAYGLYNTTMSRTDYGSGIARNGSSGSYAYTVTSAFINRPVNYVSYGDAMRFANWLHNGQPIGAQDASTTESGAYYVNGATTNAALQMVSRKADWRWAVTSEDEWYKAAYHKNDGVTGNYFKYPTKSNDPPGQDMADVSKNNANYWTGPGLYTPIDWGRYTTVVGEFQDSASAYGTFDQGGNVWEWNETILDADNRRLRGGAFYVSWSHLLASGCDADNASHESDCIGFLCPLRNLCQFFAFKW